MTTTVRDDRAESRYEIYDGEQLAGFADYRLDGGQLALTHTEVDPEFGGRGLARQLVGAALDDARGRDLAVLPYCPYVRKVIAQNAAAYLDLVPETERARFGLTEVAR